MNRTAVTTIAGLLALVPVAARSQSADAGLVTQRIVPSHADPAIRDYDEPDIAIVPTGAAPGVSLAVFRPGTHGSPERARLILHAIARQGYRVIGLMYDDGLAGDRICDRFAPPDCIARFREMAISGRGPAPDTVPPAESIESRLASVLTYLDRQSPARGWGAYLTAQGAPRWDRILLTGLSQGAGMAAYIAKQQPVERVVLFSSPWDSVGREHRPAPWLSGSSATPPDRWWAEREVNENTTRLIANAYRALGIPSDHVLLFDAPLMSAEDVGENPYHGQTIRNPAYAPQWKLMFGTASASPSPTSPLPPSPMPSN